MGKNSVLGFTSERGAISGLGTGLLVGSLTRNPAAGIGTGLLASQVFKGGRPKKTRARKSRSPKSRTRSQVRTPTRKTRSQTK